MFVCSCSLEFFMLSGYVISTAVGHAAPTNIFKTAFEGGAKPVLIRALLEWPKRVGDVKT